MTSFSESPLKPANSTYFLSLCHLLWVFKILRNFLKVIEFSPLKPISLSLLKTYKKQACLKSCFFSFLGKKSQDVHYEHPDEDFQLLIFSDLPPHTSDSVESLYGYPAFWTALP